MDGDERELGVKYRLRKCFSGRYRLLMTLLILLAVGGVVFGVVYTLTRAGTWQPCSTRGLLAARFRNLTAEAEGQSRQRKSPLAPRVLYDNLHVPPLPHPPRLCRRRPYKLWVCGWRRGFSRFLRRRILLAYGPLGASTRKQSQDKNECHFCLILIRKKCRLMILIIRNSQICSRIVVPLICQFSSLVEVPLICIESCGWANVRRWFVWFWIFLSSRSSEILRFLNWWEN